ncbi:MAG TPA: TonB-dependent receptor [Steroidobacteraceae bacterium]|nr:TonB-dependent receptor [Steroidobacteraceae bacterium]
MRATAHGPFELLAGSTLAAAFLTSWLGLAGPAAAGNASQAGTSATHATEGAAQSTAQDSDSADAPSPAPASLSMQSLQEVVVTGSRIKQPTLTGSAALQVVNSAELKAEGTQSIETMLNALPSVQGNFSLTQTSNPGGARGVANVDLRGLGPSRTLTLIDGKRVMPGSPLGGPEADLNFIPQALIERVEVLTGGASSVYGSDAVAGVVNFIMKKDFNGFAIDSQGNITGAGDGASYDTTLIWGSNLAGGAGNVTLYAGYSHFNAVSDGQRPFGVYALATLPNGQPATSASQCQAVYGPASIVAFSRCSAGSSAIPNGRFISDDRAAAGLAAAGIVDPAGSPAILPDNGEQYNFNPLNYLRLPDDRYNLGGFAHRELSPHLDLYGSAMFMQDESITQAAPDAIINTFNVNCDNPLLSAQEQAWLCADAGLSPTSLAKVVFFKRTVEAGNREDDIRHTDYRIVFGAKGALVDDFSYDISVQRGESRLDENFSGVLSETNLQQALLATTGPNGSVVCENPAGGCVPANVFQVGGLTAAQLKYLGITAQEQGTTVEKVGSASVSGDLTPYHIVSPLAKNGVGVAAGLEYRQEALNFLPDQEYQSGALGSPTPPVSGRFNVRDYFGELQLPVIEDRPYARLLQLDTAYRLSDYQIQGRGSSLLTHAYKFGVRYAPIRDVTLRWSWNRAVRAPDINELFFPSAVGGVTGSDPCSGAINPATGVVSGGATLAQCERTGVTAAQYGTIQQCPAGLCNGLGGGNRDLQAESAITRQLGVVLTPRFLRGFAATIDYYEITISKEIGTVRFGTVLTECINQGLFCDAIHRGSAGELFGSPTAYVSGTNVNVGYVREKGVDFSFDYHRDLSDFGLRNAGRVALSFAGTYLKSLEEQAAPGVPAYDCAGLYGFTCGFPRPHWRHTMRATWLAPSDWAVAGLGVSLRWRYIGSASLDKNQTGTILAQGTPDLVDAVLDRRQYLDLTLSYQMRSQDVAFRFGVNNLTGVDPPLTSTTGANSFANPQFFGDANTYPVLYDSLGRVIFLGVTANF